MSSCNWQKSSFSGEGANCLNLAALSVNTPLLRESDDPGTVLATTPARLAALLVSVKAGSLPPMPGQ